MPKMSRLGKVVGLTAGLSVWLVAGGNPSPRPLAVPEGFHGTTIFRAKLPSDTPKLIALTFDDGPWPRQTDQILRILAQEQVKATFFWVGRHLSLNRRAAKRVVLAGHAVGNHTWNHRYGSLSTGQVADEVDRTERLIRKVTGHRPELFRPPGGILTNGLAAYAKQKGYVVVLWNAAAPDMAQPVDPQVFANRIVSQARPGGIILMHDGGGNRSSTIAALPQIIRRLKAQGYRFVTVPGLLQAKAESTSSVWRAPKARPNARG